MEPEIIFSMRRRPPRRSRRVRIARFCSWMLMVLGALALLDAAVTIVWQEPLSALYTTFKQKSLEGQLREIERRGPSLQERAALERVHDEERRVLLLAEQMERTSHAGDPIGRIDIPRIKSNFILIDGTGTSELEAGPGLYLKSSYPQVHFPGVPGTTAIAGHRTTFLEPFKHIAELRKGEHIYVTMPYAKFVYTITGERAVYPTDIEAVVGTRGYTRLVLSSCTPEFSAEKRLLVEADLTSVTPRGAAVLSSRDGAGSKFKASGALVTSPTPS